MVDTVTHHETGSSFTSFSDNFDCVVTLYGDRLNCDPAMPAFAPRVHIFRRSRSVQTVLKFLTGHRPYGQKIT